MLSLGWLESAHVLFRQIANCALWLSSGGACENGVQNMDGSGESARRVVDERNNPVDEAGILMPQVYWAWLTASLRELFG